MNPKKFLAGTLAVGMLAASIAAMPVLAEDETPALPEASEDVVAEMVPERITLVGNYVSYEEGQMTIFDGVEETVINMDENTRVLSSADALPVEIESIEADTEITVIASSAMTMSLPPQVYGYVILVGENAPLYGVVGEAIATETGFDFLTDDNNYIFRASEETEVLPFLTRNIVRAEDITPGSELLVYSDIMTMSIPAQVPANKIIVLSLNTEIVEENEDVVPTEPEEEVTEQIVTDMTKVNVNGNEVAVNILTETTEAGDEILMVPVRAVAEAMGLEVNWDGTLQAVTVGTIPMGINFKVGEDSYNKARMMPFTLGAAPKLVASDDANFAVTYVPASLFTEVVGAVSEVVDGVMNLLFN